MLSKMKSEISCDVKLLCFLGLFLLPWLWRAPDRRIIVSRGGNMSKTEEESLSPRFIPASRIISEQIHQLTRALWHPGVLASPMNI